MEVAIEKHCQNFAIKNISTFSIQYVCKRFQDFNFL